jgi:probable DNA repair protein
LLQLGNELLAHLQGGGTLIVPSRQRATAVRLAHSAAQLAAGQRVWPSPDVLPWSAWIERELDAARARGEALPRRLNPSEEWLLWREAVHTACSGFSLLMPDALIEPVRRAVAWLADYGLSMPPASGAESALLLQARAAFRRRCVELEALASSSWYDCRAHLRPSGALLLAGFSTIGPARRQWLEQHGARVVDAPPEDSPPDGASAGAAAQVVGCDDPWHEAEAAAQWCAEQLRRDAHARLLLVVPRLTQQRHLWERALSQRLDLPALLLGVGERGSSAFAIEGGQPLSSYPLVATALQLVAIATGRGSLAELSAVLRSSYLAALDRHHALRLELWLREHDPGDLDGELLARLLVPVRAALGDPGAAVLQTLLAGINAVTAATAAPPAIAGPDVWARSFAQLLALCGWPGAHLGADEQQVRMRFDELLGDLAAIAAPIGRMSAAEAGDLLRQLAGRAAFEPASDDVPVTVTASLDDPIVHYDAIWVAGLSAEVWPPAAQPDPLLPGLLQIEAGVLEASAAGQLRLALRRMQHWRQRSACCAWSWPRSDADLPRDRSALLGETPASAVAPEFELHAWLVEGAPALEPWRDQRGAAWPAAREPRGGTRLLELQSQCPFRAFAELRLQARPLPQSQPGIDARLRGQLLHGALEQFWRATAGTEALRARGPEATRALVHACVQSAAARLQARVAGAVDQALWRREAARARRLFEQLLEWELEREAFEIQALEQPQRLALAGTALPLRLDRVDRLADGRLLVIDYKSGATRSFDAYAERPPSPQLPAYALSAGEQVAAVMAVYLGRERMKIRGIADRAGRLPRLPGGRARGVVDGGEPGWAPLLHQWREQLERLMREFLDGHAAVDPQPGACEYCHLPMLCRVDVGVLTAAAVAPSDDDDELPAPPSERLA